MYRWNDIVNLYEDIISTNIDESDFVIDLEDALSHRSAPEYYDSQLFINRTFLTKSLHSILKNISKKFETGEGSSIYSIRTPFGGGKTHTLLTIYHFLSSSTISDKNFSNLVRPKNVRIGRIVGTYLNPLIGSNKENFTIKTLWGELSYQLGENEGYMEFFENDQKLISPGKGHLKSFFEKKQPFILLFDEILEYIVKAQGVPVTNTDLGVQTLAFIQELVETIAILPNALLIVTLPDNEEEIFSPDSKKLFKKLLKILGRIETLETPASRLEIIKIVQKKFFKEVVNNQAKKLIITKFLERSNHLRKSFPDLNNSEIKSIFDQSYPFHPDILLTLINNWDSFKSFQRIRGVLRVVQYILYDMLSNEEKTEIILPFDINFNTNRIKDEFLKHISSKYEKILISDVFELESKIESIEYQKEPYIKLFKDITVTIFFHSFSNGILNGITEEELTDLFVNDVIPPKMISESIDYLTNNLWYLKKRGSLLQFILQPNLNKIIADIKKNFTMEAPSFLEKLLVEKLGSDLLGIVWPKKSNDILDNQTLKLVLIHPETKNIDVKAWMKKRNRSFRLYKNTIILSYPNIQEYDKCIDLILNLHAINHIKQYYKDYFSNGFSGVNELDTRLDMIRKDIVNKIFSIYNTVEVNNRNFNLSFPENSNMHLTTWVKQILIKKEKIVDKLHPRVLTTKFFSSKEKIRTKDILNHILRSPDSFMLESPNVLKKTIQEGVKNGDFDIINFNVMKQSNSNLVSKNNISLKEITFSDEEYLVKINTLKKNHQKNQEIVIDAKIKNQEKLTYKYSIRVENINSKELSILNNSLKSGIDLDGNKLTFNIEIDFNSDKGIDRKVIKKKIKETLSQLGVDITKEYFE